MVLLLTLLACRDATVVSACDEDPANCVTCIDDGQCVLMGNPCLSTVYCAEQDLQLSTIDIGCTSNAEYTWPPPSSCTCQANRCAPTP